MLPFEAGCTHLVIGQSGSGKTEFIFKILRNKDVMFGENPPKVIKYYYGIWQDTFKNMLNEVQGLSFHEGLPTQDEILNFTDPNSHSLIILDDVMQAAANSEVVELIFTRISHHRYCSCFYLQQNAFI